MRCMGSNDAPKHQKSAYTERYTEDCYSDSDQYGLPHHLAAHLMLLSAAARVFLSSHAPVALDLLT